MKDNSTNQVNLFYNLKFKVLFDVLLHPKLNDLKLYYFKLLLPCLDKSLIWSDEYLKFVNTELNFAIKILINQRKWFI